MGKVLLLLTAEHSRIKQDMAEVTPAGAAFLATLVVTGWSGVLLLLSPAFALLLLARALLDEPLRSRARALYRRVTRFVCVSSAGSV